MPTSHRPARLTAALLALLTWAALALQFYLSASNHLPNLLLNFFSFFTVLTNLLVAVVTTRTAIAGPRSSPATSPPDSGRPSPSLQAATAVYITVVALGYTLLLRHLWNPQGAQKLADTLLHDVIPVLYDLFWLFLCRPRRRLPWSAAAAWLLWPAIYLTYSLVRGALTGWYPYPFLDHAAVGSTRLFAVVSGFILSFLVLGLAAVALTRRSSPPGAVAGLAHPAEGR